MSIVYKKIESPEPKIIEATLLSSEEIAECREFIPDLADMHLPSYYYLRTPYEDNKIGLAWCNFEDSPANPSYFDDAWTPEGHRASGTGIRPMLRIESPVLSEAVTLNPGDKIILNGETFDVISDTILLLNTYINVDEETGDCGIFDPATNIYEESEAKKIVDEWAKQFGL